MSGSNNGKTLSALRSRISIEQQQLVSDTGGGYTKTWNSFAQVWAHLAPSRGDERLQGLQLTGEVTHRVTIRYLSGVSVAMRVVYGSRYLNIRAVLNHDERNEYLLLLCEEGVAI